MNDLISRQAAIEGTKRIPDLTVYAFCSFIDMLTNMPTAEKKGKWIEEDIHSNWSDWTLYFCSECGRQFKDLEERNFCPNCGARMEE